jgi:hypothetical protein
VKITRVIVSVIAGSTLAGWFGWPVAESAPMTVDIVGPCSRTTRQWAETWRATRTSAPAVVRVSVLCRADGWTDTATLMYSPSAGGPRVVSWRPVTTFFGILPPHGAERVDMFGQNGELVEYATVDRQAGHIEFYSATSRLLRHGPIDALSGRAERFDGGGRRPGSLFVPIPPAIGDDG